MNVKSIFIVIFMFRISICVEMCIFPSQRFLIRTVCEEGCRSEIHDLHWEDAKCAGDILLEL